MTVTFFGHKDITGDVAGLVENTIIHVIKKYGANMFLVGNQGGFDRLVQSTLKKLYNSYNIDYRIVLAYMPTAKMEQDMHKTIVFDGCESVPPKYAIPKCNRWMIDKSDIVIVYVTHNIGGAAKFKDIAHKQGKRVINIAEL